MAEFKLGRIRFVWKGDWTTSTTYYVDDVIRYGGRTFICAVGHTSAADFYTDLDYAPTKWNQMSDGQEWRGDWSTSTFYKVNDLVKYGGLVYIANESHTSNASEGSGSEQQETTTGLEADQSKWTLFAEGLDWKGAWTTTTRFKVGDIVKYGGYSYVANTGHTSAATDSLGLENQSSFWDIFNPGIEYKGAWSNATRYKVNDVVKEGAGLWICIAQHTSTADFGADLGSSYWEQFVEGFEFEDTWSDATTYQHGDIVRYGGNQYVSKTVNVNNNPRTETDEWSLFSESFKYQGDWDIGTSYKIGDVIRRNGYTYRAVTDAPSFSLTATASSDATNRINVGDTTGLVVGMNVQFSGTVFGDVIANNNYYIQSIASATEIIITDIYGGAARQPATATGSMTAKIAANPVDTNYYARLNSGISWQGEWSDDREYIVGDAVRYGSNAYICVLAHRSEGDDGSSITEQGGGADNSRPDQDISGTYWNVLSIGSDTDVLTTQGDLVYYSGAGPTRLPIGIEGQVLRSDGTYPEWATIGRNDQVYYVAPNGTDLPAPVHGLTIDKPFATIRYACEQIEKGPRNPNAQRLLELNRVFLQRETSSWIEAQVAGGSGIWAAFDYDEYKCERDVGYIIDRLIWDIGHGGNLKVRAAALSFVNGFSADGEFSAASEDKVYGSGLANEAEQSVAAYGYLETIIGNVLNNTAPSVAYQTPGGDDSTAVATQYIDTDYTTEAGVYTTIQSLLKIVTDTITAGDTSAIPTRVVPNALVKVSAGQYKEVLPIIVPAETCILGDEVRSTNVKAAAATDRNTDISDSYYSVETLDHFKDVAGKIIQGTTVSAQTGNVETQWQEWPYADDADTKPRLDKLVDSMKQEIDRRLGTMHLRSTTDPTGYNTASFLETYGNARTLLRENRKFFQEEVIAYLVANYPNLKYGKTDTREDVGHIIDAITWDMTYGGNYQSVIAARSYWDADENDELKKPLIPASIQAATLAVHAYLRTLIGTVAQNNTIVSPLQTTYPQYRGTGGNAAAATFAQEHLDIITNSVAGDSVGADLPSVTVASISSNVITTSANHGLQVGDAFTPLESSNNLVANTTYWIISTPAANTLTIAENFGDSVFALTDAGSLSVPAHVINYPELTDGVTSTTALINAITELDQNSEALVTAMTTYITDNYPNLTYNSTKCKRDLRYILEAQMFDIALNSNFATMIAANAYTRSSASEVYAEGQKAATLAAYNFVRETIAGDTATYLNSDATAASRADTLWDLVDTIIFAYTAEGDVCQTTLRVRDYARLHLERNRAFIKADVAAYIDNTYTDTVTATSAGDNSLTVTDTSWIQRNTAIRFTGTAIGGLSTGTTYYVYDVPSSTTFRIATERWATTPITLTSDTGSMGVDLYYNETLCARDVDTYIDALKWDLQWTSNYKSRYVARYYANAVLGSQEEDFYYLRNGTGVRNQTVDGLNGDLTPENAYGTSRVTAGAYASLDPGWGPDDFRTWIIARSPYVQNVTTFGSGAIGQKIDGALHNGGNDSIVSNDFTQVISDGIGAWVANNGRAELVSVFTYYSHIGYLSTEGGRIRGTNGNNSYGDFGSVAEGFDTSESEGTAIVDNKLQYEATVGSVFTDGVNEILQLEFENAGEDYTEATFGFFGAGSNAAAEQDKEFRDDAVFNVRLLDNVDDSTNAPEADGNLGGSGYITSSSTAQGGTTTQITIAATDSQFASAYIGMKIYLTGGTGVGQFGIIDTYNSGTKIATVTKPSTGAAGWDHLVQGRTIAAPDASTTYTIEPALSFTAPPYSSTAKTLSLSSTYADVAYDANYASYENSTQDSTTGSGSSATFDITRKGNKYIIDLDAGGTGYAIGDTITILGSNLGGVDSTNDITITVTSINSATGAILAFDQSGYGAGGYFLALPSASGDDIVSSVDGTTWSTLTGILPVTATWSSIASGRLTIEETAGNFVTGRSYTITDSGDTPWTAIGAKTIVAGTIFVSTGPGSFATNVGKATPNATHTIAIASGVGVDDTAVSINGGQTWSAGGNLPSTGTWNDVAYGDGRWVAIKTGTNETAITADGGTTWTAGGTLPATTTWESVAYGGGKWVAIASGGTNVAYSSDNGATWVAGAGLASSNWNSVAYGNNRFVAVSATNGTIASVSVDGGANWVATTLPSTEQWQHVEYGQGVFLAVSDSNNGATSPDGVVWTARALSTAGSGFSATAFGNPNKLGRFISVDGGTGTVASDTRTGATAVARAFVAEEKIFAIRLHEPGSGYTSGAPTLTITDPNNTFEAPASVRIADGVLANPSFSNRGTGFISASADLDTGDGFANFFQSGQFIAVRRLSGVPAVGSNVVFGHLPNRVFKLVQVLTLLGEYDGSYTAFLQIAPDMTVFDSPPDGTSVTTRIRYSQVRLTGHDFLDIGTGNFVETNYPGTPTQSPNAQNETRDDNGGRVFFTSTDQDGNFRVGDLFSIEQSTGVATLNADAFNISGLQELTLGEVTLGGGSASITEFSTDPFFTENSDSIVPTQRAIKSYISSQIGGGGASLNVNSVTAGFIYIANNEITTTTGGIIEVKAKMNFQGGVVGLPIAFNYFLT